MNQKKKRCFAACLHAAGALLLWGVILISLLLTAPRLLGFQLYHVISGSMEPGIPIGSLIITTKAEPENLQNGEVITFYGGNQQNSIIVHRIVENDYTQKQITTKGDANAQEDIKPVPYDQVLGKLLFSVPKLGFLAAAMGTWSGKMVFLMIALIGYVLKNVLFRAKNQPESET